MSPLFTTSALIPESNSTSRLRCLRSQKSQTWVPQLWTGEHSSQSLQQPTVCNKQLGNATAKQHADQCKGTEKLYVLHVCVYTRCTGHLQSIRAGEHSTGCKGTCCSHTNQLAKRNMQTLVSTGSLFAKLAHYLKLAACKIFLERILDCTHIQLYGNGHWNEQYKHCRIPPFWAMGGLRCDWMKCPPLNGGVSTDSPTAALFLHMQQNLQWKFCQYCQ